jgi:hypothetical protein
MPADGNSDVTLLAPNDAMVLGPEVDTWLDTLATDGARRAAPQPQEAKPDRRWPAHNALQAREVGERPNSGHGSITIEITIS